jgi:hypothetical protein
MAKATIIITDNPDGSVFLAIQFDPPVGPSDDGTNAQQVAAALVQGVLDAQEKAENFTEVSN